MWTVLKILGRSEIGSLKKTSNYEIKGLVKKSYKKKSKVWNFWIQEQFESVSIKSQKRKRKAPISTQKTLHKIQGHAFLFPRKAKIRKLLLKTNPQISTWTTSFQLFSNTQQQLFSYYESSRSSSLWCLQLWRQMSQFRSVFFSFSSPSPLRRDEAINLLHGN